MEIPQQRRTGGKNVGEREKFIENYLLNICSLFKSIYNIAIEFENAHFLGAAAANALQHVQQRRRCTLGLIYMYSNWNELSFSR